MSSQSINEAANSPMHFVHVMRALRAVTMRELLKFVQQRGRLLSALVRPLMWLAVFAAGFYNVFGVSIIPPYKTYITYQVVANAPIEGFLHQTNELDTLGDDQPESTCHLDR